jgi:hypothetical protein
MGRNMKQFFCLVTTASLLVYSALFGAEHKPGANGTSEEIARHLYENYYDFYWKEMPGFSDYVTPDFYASLLKETKCKEVCAVEVDPWLDAQDGEVSEPIGYKLEAETELESSVKMSYTFHLSETQKKLQTVNFIFFREAADKPWRLSDFIGPRGNSLKKQIDEWHKEYGDVSEYEE